MKEVVCWAKWGEKNIEKLKKGKNAQFWGLKTWGVPNTTRLPMTNQLTDSSL